MLPSFYDQVPDLPKPNPQELLWNQQRTCDIASLEQGKNKIINRLVSGPIK